MEKQQDVQKELHMIFIDLERRRMGGFDDKGFEVYVEAGYVKSAYVLQIHLRRQLKSSVGLAGKVKIRAELHHNYE